MLIHCGVAPRPLALVRTQTSFKVGIEPLAGFPPNTIILLVPASYTAAWLLRAVGLTPDGFNWLQTEGPPLPLAFVRTHTSFKMAPPPPPNMMSRLEPES